MQFYLNSMIGQDRLFTRRLTRPMKDFKSVRSASATLEGIEEAHMIRKWQFPTGGRSAMIRASRP
jgi:putative transposase